MKNRVITISREFGSGGRTIGKRVAEELGIPCYDNELLTKIAQDSGFNKDYIQEAGEYSPGGFLSNAFPTVVPVPTMQTISGRSSTRLSQNWQKKAPVSLWAVVQIIFSKTKRTA